MSKKANEPSPIGIYAFAKVVNRHTQSLLKGDLTVEILSEDNGTVRVEARTSKYTYEYDVTTNSIKRASKESNSTEIISLLATKDGKEARFVAELDYDGYVWLRFSREGSRRQGLRVFGSHDDNTFETMLRDYIDYLGYKVSASKPNVKPKEVSV